MFKYIIRLSRLAFIASFIALSTNGLHSQLKTKMVTKICLKGFKTEMRFARKKPPENMDIFTCNCFIKKVSNGSGIINAQSVCKKEAAEKFNL